MKNSEISDGICVKGLPCDSSLDGVDTADRLKVTAGMPERDGLDPDSLFQDDLEGATACSRIVFSAPENDTDGRFLLAYNPREWLPEKGSSTGVILVYRSRDVFIVLSLDGAGFRMKSLKGDSEIVAEEGRPIIKAGSTPVEEIPEPEEGWFLATME